MRKIFYGFLIFIALALVSIPFIDWQSLKQPILNQLQSITGYEIDIKGPVKIQFFPIPKIVLNDASLRPTNKKIGTDSLQLVSARAKEIRLGWSWAPLLRGKLDIQHFELDTPVVILKSVKAGPKAQTIQSSSPSKTPSKPSTFSLHRFVTKSGKIVIDADTPKQKRIDNIAASGFIEGINGPAEVTGSLTYNDVKLDLHIFVLKSSETIPVQGSVSFGHKGQTYGPLSFDGFIDMQDKKVLKNHMTITYEGNTLILDSSTDFEKDQTEIAITSKKIDYQNHHLLNLQALLTIKSDDLVFKKIAGEIFEGKLDISGHFQANKKLTVQGHLHQLNLTKIPKLHDSPVKKGRLEAFTKLSLDLNNFEKWLETLSGTLTMNITGCAIETIDIEALTQQVKKIKDIQSLVQSFETGQQKKILDIKTLRADFNISNGIATTQNMQMTANMVDVKGQGSIDIPQSLLNLALNVYAKDLGKMVIPFRITGNWNAPTYGIDQEQMSSVIAKNLTQKGVDAVMDQVRKKAQGALAKGKESAQGSSDKAIKPEKIIKEVLSGLLR
ncbi:AsmA family protein [Candidatus Finniella inopinata]|nr:AsmA-like C-terminal region-containing protein [Candidatus Finniella inopinata]